MSGKTADDKLTMNLLQMFDYLFICSSQSSGGGGLSATVRANRTCRSHSFITLRAFWLSYRGTGVGVTVSTSMTESESLKTKKRLSYSNKAEKKQSDHWDSFYYSHDSLKMRSHIYFSNNFCTYNKASGWRRGLTNSVLVGRALLASGWAFHGLA